MTPTIPQGENTPAAGESVLVPRELLEPFAEVAGLPQFRYLHAKQRLFLETNAEALVSDTLRAEDFTAVKAALAASSPVRTDADGEHEHDDTDATWMDLALQFDGQRILALQLLRAIVAEPGKWQEEAAEFVKAPPLSGEKVLAARLAALSKPEGETGPAVADDEAKRIIRDLKLHSNSYGHSIPSTTRVLMESAAEALAALTVSPSPSERDQHQGEAREVVEATAARLWRADVTPVTPRRVANERTAEAFARAPDEVRGRWLRLARAALSTPEAVPVADKREGDR